ncbi:hypothetical protein [Helicobacter pylori]|uniref:hypothetical protein n=1 Tax=Helicobacter pylori TaxID=210 RepID=UPI001BB424A8|nr:hypothetical protein [Helicobacter pylori]
MEKFCHFFDFDAFCVVLAHKKTFSVTINKELDFAVTSLKRDLLGRLPLMSEKVYFLWAKSCGLPLPPT